MFSIVVVLCHRISPIFSYGSQQNSARVLGSEQDDNFYTPINLCLELLCSSSIPCRSVLGFPAYLCSYTSQQYKSIYVYIDFSACDGLVY